MREVKDLSNYIFFLHLLISYYKSDEKADMHEKYPSDNKCFVSHFSRFIKLESSHIPIVFRSRPPLKFLIPSSYGKDKLLFILFNLCKNARIWKSLNIYHSRDKYFYKYNSLSFSFCHGEWSGRRTSVWLQDGPSVCWNADRLDVLSPAYRKIEARKWRHSFLNCRSANL